MSVPEQTFRERRTFAQRQKDVTECREKHPEKIPVIIERLPGEKNLPNIDKTKFLVPQYIQVSELQKIIRKRLDLNQSQTLFLLIASKTIATGSKVISQIYQENKDDDGFLYINYGAQETFG